MENNSKKNTRGKKSKDNHSLIKMLYPEQTYENLSKKIEEQWGDFYDKKGDGKSYNRAIGNMIISGALLKTKPPIDPRNATKEEKELFDSILKTIKLMIDMGEYPLPNLILLPLGMVESEFHEARKNPTDWRYRIFSWWWTFCECCNSQNMAQGNVNSDMRKQIDATRTGGEYPKTGENSSSITQTNVIVDAKIKSDEILKSLMI